MEIRGLLLPELRSVTVTANCGIFFLVEEFGAQCVQSFVIGIAVCVGCVGRELIIPTFNLMRRQFFVNFPRAFFRAL